MRKILFLFIIGILCSFSSNSFSQAPEKFNYQAVIRDNTGEPILNQTISVRITIIENPSGDSPLYRESHEVTTSDMGLINLQIGDGFSDQGTFSSINWGIPKYIKIEVDAGNDYANMGTFQLLSVPYALYAKSADKLGAENIYSPLSDTLFVVKDHEGNVVFAVFPDGAQVYVNETAKGKVGGFAISGRSPSKAIETDIFRVTADSTRIYVNDTVSGKGKVGSFAISGRSPSKGIVNDYIVITGDSTRIYITESETKGKVGGFAISGRSPSKEGFSEIDYFNVSDNTSAQKIDPSEARIFWYPKKEAFLTGRVLVESPDSVGTNSMATGFESKSIGKYSQALGYKARAKGNISTAIGNYANAEGDASYAFGNYAVAQDSGSYAIGSGAIAYGLRSFALGSTGVDSSGIANNPTMATEDYAYAFGMGSIASGPGAFSFETQDTASGEFSLAMGYKTLASGKYSTAFGYKTIANGDYYSTALGCLAESNGRVTTSIGYKTIASRYYSIAMGCKTSAIEHFTTAMGVSTIATGEKSTVMGYGTIAQSYCSLVFGQFNIVNGYKFSWEPADPLLVAGNGSSTSNTSNAMTLFKNGNMTIAGTLTQNSDKRLKENIVRIENVLPNVLKINPVYFEFENKRTHPSGRQIGFIAQEIEPLFPELIEKDSNGFLSVEYSNMSAVLLQAIKELQSQIVELNSENKVLRKEAEDFKTRLTEIEKLLLNK